ncbi:MAG: hypothetical protein ACK52U_07190 [Synechococcaceae cyanobacterium]
MKRGERRLATRQPRAWATLRPGGPAALRPYRLWMRRAAAAMMKRLEQVAALVVAAGLAIVS